MSAFFVEIKDKVFDYVSANPGKVLLVIAAETALLVLITFTVP